MLCAIAFCSGAPQVLHPPGEAFTTKLMGHFEDLFDIYHSWREENPEYHHLGVTDIIWESRHFVQEKEDKLVYFISQTNSSKFIDSVRLCESYGYHIAEPRSRAELEQINYKALEFSPEGRIAAWMGIQYHPVIHKYVFGRLMTPVPYLLFSKDNHHYNGNCVLFEPHRQPKPKDGFYRRASCENPHLEDNRLLAVVCQNYGTVLNNN